MSLNEALRRIIQCQKERSMSLDLSGLRLENLPPEIGQLQNLQELNISSNQLRELPPEIGKLRMLQEFNVSFNLLSKLPPEIEQLQNLQKLIVSSNQLRELPSEIGQFKNLQQLNASDNKLSEVPLNITQLNLDWNWDPGLLASGISFYNNPLEFPPVEIVKQGRDAVREYFVQMKKNEGELKYEGKVLFVGQGGVGKTSLMKRLIEDGFQERERTTEGIDIRHWSLLASEDSSSNLPMQLNVWDFGGQEIYHSTHQFFLTRRSLYLFVWDARQEDEYGRIDYWLRTIRTFAEDSPILLVMNKADERTKEINLKDIKDRFPQVVDTFRVSAKTGEGIRELKEAIRSQAWKLPLMGIRWPQTWLDIGSKLENERQNHIPREAYLKLCAEKTLDEEQALILSQYLHDLGVVLHFEKDLLLQHTLILKPEWGTDAVYKVLDALVVQKRNGLLFEGDLSAIWNDPHCYPPEKYPTLLRLMSNFELAFLVGEGDKTPSSLGRENRYIVAELLSPVPLELEEEANLKTKNVPLRFEYHYDFLPAGVFTRFIVRMHESIRERVTKKGVEKLCWKEGAFLQYENNYAKIKVIPHQKKVEIDIDGEDPRAFLAIIRHDFEKIHATLNKVQVAEKIPCSCTPGCNFRFDYSFLLRAEKKGIIEVPCNETLTMIKVKSLLEGIEPVEVRRIQAMDFDESLEIDFNSSLKKESYSKTRKTEIINNVSLQQILEKKEASIKKETFRVVYVGMGALLGLLGQIFFFPTAPLINSLYFAFIGMALGGLFRMIQERRKKSKGEL